MLVYASFFNNSNLKATQTQAMWIEILFSII